MYGRGDFLLVIKDVFEDITQKFPNNVCIMQKFEHKDKFKEITYKKFREDVLALGISFLDILKLKGKRIMIISENTYDWYVTYMCCLITGIIAVPVDKELPPDEILNVAIRSKVSAIVYSAKKKEAIDKIKSELKDVDFFINMYNSEIIES